MLSQVKEVIFNPTIRSWMFFKLRNFKDQGERPIKLRPSYVPNDAWTSCFKKKNRGSTLPSLQPLPFAETHEIPKSIKIKLANRDFELSLVEENIFRQQFSDLGPDEENIEALFRFSWLLTRIEDQGHYTSLEEMLIKSWMKASADGDFAWRPYTVSERLANIGIFLLRSRSFDRWDKDTLVHFQNIVQKEAKAILRELEYWGDAYTCNHLSNNGRGLMWAGVLSGNVELVTLGHKIISEEAKRIIQPNGILREGSTHYHFLITRNYIEAFWILKQFAFEDKIQSLRPLVDKMVASCQFLELQGINPLIGDISPDYPPSWFCHVPHAWNQISLEQEGAQKAKGWASHFCEKVAVLQSDKFQEIRDDFARMDKGHFSVLTHLNLKGVPILPGHSHRDSGCPVVVYKGRPVLIDLGRKSYTRESAFYRSAFAHNSVLIDGLEHEIEPRGVFGPRFLSYQAGRAPEWTMQNSEIQITHYGYMKYGIVLTRMIQIQDQKIILKYKISGKKNHLVSIYLHFIPDNVKEIILPNGEAAQIKESKNNGQDFGIFAYEYGKTEKCTTWLWEKKMNLPAEFEISIIPMEYV